MVDNIAPKAKYIPWVLSALLIVILIVSVNQLYNNELSNSVLKNANDSLTEKQKESDKIIRSQNDSITSYHKQLKDIGKRREARKEHSIEIKNTHAEEIKIIISDDAVADANAIADIYRTYTFD
jgi:hypothetical protein